MAFKFRIKPKSIPFPSIKMVYPRLPMVGWRVPLITLPTVGQNRLKSTFLAVGLGVGALAIGIYFSVQGLQDSPTWPDPAVYEAGQTQRVGDATIHIGQRHKIATQTLRLNVAGARIETIRFENVSIGKATGLTDSILITGDLNQTGDLIAYLRCETVSFDGLVSPMFSFTQSEVFDLVIASSTADGASLSQTLNNTPIDITFASTRGSLNVPRVKDSTFDRIIIDVGASDATCKTLEFINVLAFGAGVSVGAVKAGTFVVENSLIGTGDGINTPDFVVADTVLVQVADVVGLIDDIPISVE
jgi:hypothetical protein